MSNVMLLEEWEEIVEEHLRNGEPLDWIIRATWVNAISSMTCLLEEDTAEDFTRALKLFSELSPIFLFSKCSRCYGFKTKTVLEKDKYVPCPLCRDAAPASLK